MIKGVRGTFKIRLEGSQRFCCFRNDGMGM